MADDVTLRVLLTGVDKSASVTIAGVGQAAEKTEKKARGMGGGFATVGAALAGLGIAKMTGDLLGFGLKTAMGMEQAKIGFTTMLGSGKKAEAFLDKLKKFAAETPFEFPELQTAASSLISAGINANKVIPIMTTLGDVTSGMGTGAEGVKRATVALQQMNAAGKISAEDLNQLRDAGIPVFDLLAKATHKSKAEIVAMAQSGELGAKELSQMMAALESGKGLERFNGLMSKQSQSLTGIISTLQDTVGQGLAAALGPLIPMIKEAIGAFTDALPPILDGIKGLGGWISKNKELLGYLAKGVIAVAAVTGAIWLLNAAMTANPVGIIVVALAALVAGLLWCYDNVKWFRDGVNTAFTALGAIGRWLWNNALAPVIRAIVSGFAWVVGGLANMLDALGHVPGFEWAQEAAIDLRGLAHDADVAAHNIGDIPDPAVQTRDSLRQIDTLNTKIRGIKGKIVKAQAKGDTKEVDRLRAKLKALKDKKVQVEAHVKKTGITTIKPINTGHGIKISAYASGGRARFDQLAVVGERGPELVQLPAGAEVYSNEKSRRMIASGSPSALSSMGGATTIYQTTNNIDAHGLLSEKQAGAHLERVFRDLKASRRGRPLAFEGGR